jgi:putative hydrolase of the HAD superfamily
MTIILNRANLFGSLPDAVLFDTDNTLYPYDPAHKAAMDAVRAKAIRLFGIEKEKFDETFGMARDAVKDRV